MRRTWSAALGPKGDSGSSPSIAALVEEVDPAGSDRHRPAALGAHEDEPDALVVAERRQQPRVQRLDLLERDPPRDPREADQPEAARCHHRELRDLPAVRLLDVLADVGVERDRPVGDAAAGHRPHRPPGHRVVAGELGQAGAHVAERVVAALRWRR